MNLVKRILLKYFLLALGRDDSFLCIFPSSFVPLMLSKTDVHVDQKSEHNSEEQKSKQNQDEDGRRKKSTTTAREPVKFRPLVPQLYSSCYGLPEEVAPFFVTSVSPRATPIIRNVGKLFTELSKFGIKIIRTTSSIYICILRTPEHTQVRTTNHFIQKLRCDCAHILSIFLIQGLKKEFTGWQPSPRVSHASQEPIPHSEPVEHICFAESVAITTVYQQGKDVVAHNFDPSCTIQCVGGIYYFPLLLHENLATYITTFGFDGAASISIRANLRHVAVAFLQKFAVTWLASQTIK